MMPRAPEAVLNFSDVSGDLAGAQPRQAHALAREVGLARVAELGGRVRQAPVRLPERAEALEAEDTVERLGPVAHRLPEDPPELALTDEERVAQRTHAAAGPPQSPDRFEDERVRRLDLRQPLQQVGDPALPDVLQGNPQVPQLAGRQTEGGAGGARSEPEADDHG